MKLSQGEKFLVFRAFSGGVISALMQLGYDQEEGVPLAGKVQLNYFKKVLATIEDSDSEHEYDCRLAFGDLMEMEDEI